MGKPPEVRKQYYTKLMDVYRYNPIYIPFLNDLIRFIQKNKYQRDISRITRLTINQSDVIKEWYKDHRFFFGFGLYRSGTTFLADFLNKLVDEAIVGHEVNVNDYWDYPNAIHSLDHAKSYIEEYRLNEIYFRNQSYDFKVYGEINPFLRRHCQAIKEVFLEAKLFQVVRNPKNVIRSLMSRELFGWKDPMGKLISLSENDEYIQEWKRWGRFEKLCWMWASDNELLRECCGHTIKFELLLKDYDYFKENVLDYLGLGLSDEKWLANINAINNPTPHYKFPEYKDWPKAQKETFKRICGEEMAKYGY